MLKNGQWSQTAFCSIASGLPALPRMLTYHHGMKEMPDVRISILSTRKNAKTCACGGTSPSMYWTQILPESCLAAIQTAFLQNRTITLCKERINPDPQERED